MTTQTITAQDNTVYTVGKVISPTHFKITCKGCKAKFNNFVRYCLPSDSIKWNCQNCSSEFTLFCKDLSLTNESTLLIRAFGEKRGDIQMKEYALINNLQFREIKQAGVEQ